MRCAGRSKTGSSVSDERAVSLGSREQRNVANRNEEPWMMDLQRGG